MTMETKEAGSEEVPSPGPERGSGADGRTGGGPVRLELQPIARDEAIAWIAEHHRHHLPPLGYRFAIACNDGARVVGVVTVGRPVSRHLDDGWTAELTRCCTDGTPHVASKLYAAAWRAARAMGYRRLISYTLVEEAGTSLRAAGWRALYQTKAEGWNRPSRPRVDAHPTGTKTLWEMAS